MTKLRTVKYQRHEFHDDPEPYEGSLLTFVYDIPYFPACGVFPPLHILNQVLSSGGLGGGMSPGATWEPFTLGRAEYDGLAEAVRRTPLREIKPFARYASARMKFDDGFDHLKDLFEWTKAVCDKQRASRRARRGRGGGD